MSLFTSIEIKPHIVAKDVCPVKAKYWVDPAVRST